MNAGNHERRTATVRALSRLHWIWLVPVAAAAIVLYLGWHSLVDRGPVIIITFESAEGLVPGQTTIQHRSVVVGTVQTVSLSPDMSWAIVQVRMNREIMPCLNTGTHFWIVRPRITASGISGLTTILSGSYIEMDPGNGAPTKEFKGFDEDSALLKPTEPGRDFVLITDQLGSIAKESKVTYHGIPAGQVLGYKLDTDRQKIEIFIHVFSPYDNLVTAQSYFWNASGINIGSIWSGFKISGTGLDDLISGGTVAFDTPTGKPGAGAASKPGGEFLLFDNEKDALADKPPQPH